MCTAISLSYALEKSILSVSASKQQTVFISGGILSSALCLLLKSKRQELIKN